MKSQTENVGEVLPPENWGTNGEEGEIDAEFFKKKKAAVHSGPFS